MTIPDELDMHLEKFKQIWKEQLGVDNGLIFDLDKGQAVMLICPTHGRKWGCYLFVESSGNRDSWREEI